jgi:hypothetical protein
MIPPREDSGGREDDRSPAPPPPPSSRVRLEVAFLDADRALSMPAPPPLDERTCLTVLVVAAEADFRRYVRECLRERTDLRLVEAATVNAAIALATHQVLEFLVVDEPASDVVAALSELRAIIVVDDVPRGAPDVGTRRRLLTRPFSADRLLAEVDQLLLGNA